MRAPKSAKMIAFTCIAVAAFSIGNPEGSHALLTTLTLGGALVFYPMFSDAIDDEPDVFNAILASVANCIPPFFVSLCAVIAGAIPQLILVQMFGPHWWAR